MYSQADFPINLNESIFWQQTVYISKLLHSFHRGLYFKNDYSSILSNLIK